MSILNTLLERQDEILELIRRGTTEAQGWQKQHVDEAYGGFRFQRLWRNTDFGRLHLHRFDRSGAGYWHPHFTPIAVLGLGPGAYEHRVARLDGDWGPQEECVKHLEVTSRSLYLGSFIYELEPGTWHSVRTYDTCYTIMLHGLEAAGRDGGAPPKVELKIDLRPRIALALRRAFSDFL